MTTINHWGKWIDSEKATTGVLSIHEVAWEWIDDEICLDCEKIIEEIENDEELDEDEKQNELDFIECDPSHDKLIGDWKKVDGLYEPDEEGEFAAIVREFTVQVVWSKFTTKGNPCSPCFPGQISIGSDETGDFLAYDLPDWAKYKPEEMN